MVRTLRGPYGNNQANHLFILDKKIKKKQKQKNPKPCNLVELAVHISKVNVHNGQGLRRSKSLPIRYSVLLYPEVPKPAYTFSALLASVAFFHVRSCGVF